ncbi:MAG: TetR/AcrR family transcriptional regulator [Lachnospiraceae bacterium]|nr:TetR/AcrR family transcriptional regulator [Lachnospiraceae bacterium]
MAKITKDMILDHVLTLLEQKSPDRITVTEICDGLGINRNTFYYHFADLYELLDSLFEREDARFAEEEGASDITEDYERRVAFLVEHKKAVENIYHSTHRERFTAYLNRLSAEFVDPYVRRETEGLGLTEEDLRYICGFYECALEGLVCRWLERDMPVLSRDVHKRFAESFYATLKGMAESCRKREK